MLHQQASLIHLKKTRKIKIRWKYPNCRKVSYFTSIIAAWWLWTIFSVSSKIFNHDSILYLKILGWKGFVIFIWNYSKRGAFQELSLVLPSICNKKAKRIGYRKRSNNVIIFFLKSVYPFQNLEFLDLVYP